MSKLLLHLNDLQEASRCNHLVSWAKLNLLNICLACYRPRTLGGGAGWLPVHMKWLFMQTASILFPRNMFKDFLAGPWEDYLNLSFCYIFWKKKCIPKLAVNFFRHQVLAGSPVAPANSQKQKHVEPKSFSIVCSCPLASV